MSACTRTPRCPTASCPAPRPRGEPKGDLAPVPVWAPLAALLVAFFVVGRRVPADRRRWSRPAAATSTPSGPPGLVISATLIQDAALIGAALLFAAIWARGLTPASFGLRPDAAAAGGRLDAAGLGRVPRAHRDLRATLVGQPDQQELTRDLKDEESTAALIGYAVLLAFVAPLCEEFFFRGFMFGVLREKIGVAGGALVTGLVFGARARRRLADRDGRRAGHARRPAVPPLLAHRLAAAVHRAARAQQRHLVRRSPRTCRWAARSRSCSATSTAAVAVGRARSCGAVAGHSQGLPRTPR